ncbi:HAD-like domain-containing protein [Cryomyces antarcticus]
MSTTSKPPKALLFDIGGVCVVSPFQAILDYETAHGIPPGWVNFSISRSAPNGAWQRLERGEIPLDAAYFAAFGADLGKEALWREYYGRALQKGYTTAAASDSSASASASASPPSPGSSTVMPTHPSSAAIPPVPRIDAEALFWLMMSISRTPDPYMYPALRRLRASGRYLLAALSNTVIFPPDHPYSNPTEAEAARDVRALFDVFVSSAHVGLRKPDPRIYALAMQRLRDFAGRMRPAVEGEGAQSAALEAAEVVFLDDIGENLKAARAVGMRTIKVHLGRTKEAVRELEEITGLRLLEEEEEEQEGKGGAAGRGSKL